MGLGEDLLVLVVHLLLGEGGLRVLLQVAADPVEGVGLLGAAGGGQGLLTEEHQRHAGSGVMKGSGGHEGVRGS